VPLENKCIERVNLATRGGVRRKVLSSAISPSMWTWLSRSHGGICTSGGGRHGVSAAGALLWSEDTISRLGWGHGGVDVVCYGSVS
jgi:hypothetical protein